MNSNLKNFHARFGFDCYIQRGNKLNFSNYEVIFPKKPDRFPKPVRFILLRSRFADTEW